MSVGVVTPTVPNSNDIILGDFKIYYNYDLPSEKLVGATDGGCKISIDRKPIDMKFDGQYGYQLDTNGIPLVRTETMEAMITIQSLYLKYVHKKIIANCEPDDTGWTSNNWAGTGGSYAAETTIVRAGYQSAKMTAATTAHGIKNVFTSTKDLTAFGNSEVSPTTDYIGFSIYITTAEKVNLGTSTLQFLVHKDANLTATNYFYYEIENADLTADQWTNFKILKSAFSETGTASWSAVTGISFRLDGAPTGSTILYVDCIDLIDATTDSFMGVMQGGAWQYTDETTYREWTLDLEITDDDYLENVTLIGQKHDGKMIKIVLKDCLNDGNISLALQDKKQVVAGTQFSAHYDRNLPTTFPLDIYEYVS